MLWGESSLLKPIFIIFAIFALWFIIFSFPSGINYDFSSNSGAICRNPENQLLIITKTINFIIILQPINFIVFCMVTFTIYAVDVYYEITPIFNYVI